MVVSIDVKNVLVVISDALRRDFGTAYRDNAPTAWGYDHPITLTPTIDLLAANGERFDNAFACINATDPSMSSIRSGQYPARHGIRDHGRRLTDEQQKYAAGAQTIPAMLSEQTTIAVDTLGRWHVNGFDHYVNPFDDNVAKTARAGQRILQRLPPGAVVSRRMSARSYYQPVEHSDPSETTTATAADSAIRQHKQ